MKNTVYTLEDFRPDYDHGVIGVYSSFERAKQELINILKEVIMSYENELDSCDDKDVEYTKELCGFIAKTEEAIKEVKNTVSSSYYACMQLYITEYTIK